METGASQSGRSGQAAARRTVAPAASNADVEASATSVGDAEDAGALDLAEYLEDGATVPNPTGDGAQASSSAANVVALPPGAERVPARRLVPHIPSVGLDDRVGRILLSVVLALLLWFYVINLENPEQTTTFKGLNIGVRGTGPQLKVINPLPTVDVTVRAPQNVLGSLSQSDVRPYINLQGLDGGVHNVPVQAEVNGGKGNGASVSLSPSNVQVQLEAQATQVFSVTAQTSGTPAFGYGLEAPQVDPAQVRVTASKDAMARVTQVVVPVDVDQKAGTQQGTRAPVALDSAGKEVQGVTFDPPTVQVAVPIKLLLNYKAVPVRVPVPGQPAPGYRVSNIKIDPTNVTVCCSPGLLEPLKFVETRPVPITGTTSSVITTTELLLPPGVELYPGQSHLVSITVNVEALETTLQLSVSPTAEGLSEGLTAVVSPNKLDLVLAGTFSQLQGLKPTDIRAFVNVQGRGSGTYELQPQITVPQGVKLEQASPDTVTVTLIAPTPVPPTVTAVPPTSTLAPVRTATPAPTATRAGEVAPASPIPTRSSPVATPSATATALPPSPPPASAMPASQPLETSTPGPHPESAPQPEITLTP